MATSESRRLTRRSFLKFSAMATTATALAACVPAAAPSAGGGEADMEPVVINFMSRHDFESQRPAVEQWNEENPDIQVEIDEVVGDTWDYYRIKMMQQLAVGDPPDTVFTDVWYFRLYAEDEVFVNLEPFIEADDTFSKEALWPVVVENTRSPDINGDMYCVPYDYGTHCLAYNKAMFDEMGIPHLDPAVSYDWEQDILPLALEFTQDLDGNAPGDANFDPNRINRYGINPYNYLFWWYITMAGGQCFNDDFTECTMNTPEAIEGIQFLADLMLDHKVAPSPAYQQSQPVSFQTGKMAMSIVATWDLAGWNSTIDFDWDIVNPPHRAVEIGDGRASGIAMLSASDYLDESWGWLKFLSTGDGQNYKQQTGSAIHPEKAKARNDIFMTRDLPPYNVEAFIEQAEAGGGPPFFKYWHMYIDMVPAELSLAYTGDISVEEALNTVTDKANYLLAEGQLP